MGSEELAFLVKGRDIEAEQLDGVRVELVDCLEPADNPEQVSGASHLYVDLLVSSVVCYLWVWCYATI
jgi:hypothetical protein